MQLPTPPKCPALSWMTVPRDAGWLRGFRGPLCQVCGPQRWVLARVPLGRAVLWDGYVFLGTTLEDCPLALSPLARPGLKWGRGLMKSTPLSVFFLWIGRLPKDAECDDLCGRHHIFPTHIPLFAVWCGAVDVRRGKFLRFRLILRPAALHRGPSHINTSEK